MPLEQCKISRENFASLYPRPCCGYNELPPPQWRKTFSLQPANDHHDSLDTPLETHTTSFHTRREPTSLPTVSFVVSTIWSWIQRTPTPQWRKTPSSKPSNDYHGAQILHWRPKESPFRVWAVWAAPPAVIMVTSSASPAVMMIIMTTHPLQHQCCLTPHLKCIERDGDDYDDDIDDEGDKDDDCDGNCPAAIMVSM